MFEEFVEEMKKRGIEYIHNDYAKKEQEYKEEIERLNNIIKRYDKFIRRRLELDGYSDTFIKHQMRELKTPDYNDLLNTGE